MQAQTVEISIPLEAYLDLKRQMEDDERQELRNVRGVAHSAEAEKLLQEAIVPYLADELYDIPPEQATYTLGGDVVREREESGQFS